MYSKQINCNLCRYGPLRICRHHCEDAELFEATAYEFDRGAAPSWVYLMVECSIAPAEAPKQTRPRILPSDPRPMDIFGMDREDPRLCPTGIIFPIYSLESLVEEEVDVATQQSNGRGKPWQLLARTQQSNTN